MMRPTNRSTALWLTLTAMLSTVAVQEVTAQAAVAQDTLDLTTARTRAKASSPQLRIAREGVTAALGRERQAGALPNPVLSFAREETSRGDEQSRQDILALEQRLEIGGQRGARRDAARARREGAEARLRAAEGELDVHVTKAYGAALAADRRAELAERAAVAFTAAREKADARLAAGDISAAAAWRVRLEAGRYSALRAEALLARRAARLALAALIAGEDGARVGLTGIDVPLRDPTPGAPAAFLVGAEVPDSLLRLAQVNRPELRIAALEAERFAAEARAVSRERVPSPLLSAGLKQEEVSGGGDPFTGFVAGVSLPFPLWDRRGGALTAASADHRAAEAQVQAARRQVAMEVILAFDAVRAVDAQVEVIRPQLGEPADRALRAAEAAYAEGEISLVEWLDAVRAYQEAEAAYAGLRAEQIIRRAELERAVGAQLFH